MTRDDIYEHLAQVYLGKKKKVHQENKQKFNAWLLINIIITLVIFASSFYGLTAFLAHKGDELQNKVIYALNNGPIRINYNLGYPYPSKKVFTLNVPQMSADKYKELQFTIRGMEEGFPEKIRVEVKNNKNETASVFIDSVNLNWQNVRIPLGDFKQITDWDGIAEISFILEAWNADKNKGIILIDNVCFSS